MISTRVGLQAALDGDRTKAEHSATPISVEELARDAACVVAGSRAIHLHPRDLGGRETLDAGVVDEVVTKVREACGVPVGVTTSAEIESDPERRLGHVRAWRVPDYASVNLSETGATDVMEALIEAGVGIEAGVWTVEDAERLGASGLSGRVTRILVEPGELQLLDSEQRAADAVGFTAVSVFAARPPLVSRAYDLKAVLAKDKNSALVHGAAFGVHAWCTILIE